MADPGAIQGAATLRRGVVAPAIMGTLLLAIALGTLVAYFYWRDALSRLDSEMKGVLIAVEGSAAGAAWNGDSQAAELLVQGLLTDRRIIGAALEADSFAPVAVGRFPADATRFELPLVRERNGALIGVGRIFVETDPAALRSAIVRDAAAVALIVAASITGCSFWTLILLRRRVGRPIDRLAAHAAELARKSLAEVRPLDLTGIGPINEVRALGHALEDLRLGHLTTLSQLERSEARYTLLVEGSREGIYDRDVAANTLWLSARAHQILGLPDGTLNGDRSKYLALIHPEDLVAYDPMIETVLGQRERYITALFRMRHADDSWRWILTRGRVVYDAAGAVARIVGSFGDITLQREAQDALRRANQELEARVRERTAHLEREIEGRIAAEAELRAAEAMVREIIDALPAGIQVFDAGNRLILRNRRMNDFVPHPNPAALIGTDRHTQACAVFARMAAYQHSSPAEIDAAATRVLAELDVNPRRSSEVKLLDGRLLRHELETLPSGRHLSMFMDLTAERVAEQRLRDAIEHLDSAVLLYDGDRRLRLWNSRALIMYPFLNGRLEAGMPNAAVVQQFRDAGVPLRLEASTYQRQTRAGRTELVRRIPTAEGGQLVIATDITELHEAQDALARTERLTSLGVLVAGVAHEINTPVGIGVTAMTHMTDVLNGLTAEYREGRMTRAALEEFFATAAESYQLVYRNLSRASELVASFKRISVDQASDERRAFELADYLADILASLRPELRRTPHVVALDCPPDLTLMSYPGSFSQIITNLVMNSLIHGLASDRAGRIEIAVRRKSEDRIELAFRDDGRGVPAELLPRIFEPFFTTRRGRGGSGLGLSVVYNLVTQRLGGSMRAASPAGLGLELTIELPMMAPETSEPAELMAQGEPS